MPFAANICISRFDSLRENEKQEGMNRVVQNPSPKYEDSARQGLCLPTCGGVSPFEPFIHTRNAQRRAKNLGNSHNDTASSCAHLSEEYE